MFTLAPLAAHAEVAIMSLDEAIKLALRENHRYLNLMSDAEMASLEYETARSVFKTRFGSRLSSDARLGAEVGSTYSLFLTKDNESGSGYSAGYYNSTFGDLSLSELRFSYTLPFFRNPLDRKHLAIDQAEVNLARSRRMIEIGTEELVNTVTAAYYRLAMAAREEELMRNRMLIAETSLSAQQIRQRNGQLSELELTESELALAEAQQRLDMANYEFNRQRDQFKLLLGRRVGDPLDINTDVLVRVEGSLLTLSLDALEARASSYRTELLAKAEELDMARKRIRASDRGPIPPMEISLQYALVGDGEQFDDSFAFDDHRVGVGLKMNTDFGASDRRLKQRKLHVQYTRLQREYDYLAGQVALEIRNSYHQCEQAQRKLEFVEKSLAFARKAHEQSIILHQGGNLTELELLRSSQRVSDAEQKVLAARVDYILTEQQLAVASGYSGWQ